VKRHHFDRVVLTGIVFLLAGILTGMSPVMTTATSAAVAAEPLTNAKYAVLLPAELEHPDGMTVDKNGNIILASPLAGKLGTTFLYKVDAKDNVEKYFELPAHPETGRVSPLGMAFGPDGNLYLCDGQELGGDPNHKSRVLRIVHENGKPVRSEVLVTGLVQANGLAVYGNKIYLTETRFAPAVVDVKGEKIVRSGVLCFDINEFRGGRQIHVAPYGRDPHYVHIFDTTDKERNGEWLIGANGIAFAKDGTLYVANFGDREILEIKLTPDGRKAASVRVCAKGDPMQSVDGIRVCPKGYVFVADFAGNAVHVVNPANGKIVMLAQYPLGATDEQKKEGWLDRCSEPELRNGKVYVSNIDLPFGQETNAVHTLSVIDLEGLDLDKLLK